MARKRAIISACLLGEDCRYDGKIKKVNKVVQTFKEYEIIPFCPEASLFGTPRERISIVNIDGVNRIISDETFKDVTLLLKKEIYGFMENNRNIDAIVLKSKSPSCGIGTTPILDVNKEVAFYGNGIAVSIFKEHYDCKIEDEIAIESRRCT